MTYRFAADKQAPCHEIARQLEAPVREFLRWFRSGSQSSTRAYIGPALQKRERSAHAASEAHEKIAANRASHTTDATGQIAYRVEFAKGRLAGNSEELSLGMKDLANRDGLRARVARLVSHSRAFEFEHRFTVVAATQDELDTLAAPGTAEARGLVVVDAYLKLVCPYSEYAHRARGVALEWVEDGKGILNRADGKFVDALAWSESLRAFPRGVEYLNFARLPAASLKELAEHARTHREAQLAKIMDHSREGMTR